MPANKISVSFSIELNSIEELVSILNCLSSKNHEVHVHADAVPTSVAPAPTSVTPAPADSVEEDSKEQEKQQQQDREEKKEEGKQEITIHELRAALLDKVNDHRAEIKEKLTELGAENVTTLDKSKYEELFNYLKSL